MTSSPLIDALARACALLDRSKESVWSDTTPAEVAKELRAAIGALARGNSVDGLDLRVQFAPTGPIQEIAMDNGWHDEYVRLASVVDHHFGGG